MNLRYLLVPSYNIRHTLKDNTFFFFNYSYSIWVSYILFSSFCTEEFKYIIITFDRIVLKSSGSLFPLQLYVLLQNCILCCCTSLFFFIIQGWSERTHIRVLLWENEYYYLVLFCKSQTFLWHFFHIDNTPLPDPFSPPPPCREFYSDFQKKKLKNKT